MASNLEKGIRRYSIPGPRYSWTNRLRAKILSSMRMVIGPPPGGAATGVTLAFLMERQIKDQWCWAATAKSVSIFYNNGSTWTQCLVAAATLQQQCCQAPQPCNKPWYLTEALTKTGNFVRYDNPLSFSDLQNELSTGRPIGCRIGWADGKGHFVVIHGCRTDQGINYLRIDDPSAGKSETTENGFRTAYLGTGSWTHSFITKP